MRLTNAPDAAAPSPTGTAPTPTATVTTPAPAPSPTATSPAPAVPSATPPSAPPATSSSGDCLVNEGPVLEAERDLLDGVVGPLEGDVDGDGQPDEVYLKPVSGDEQPRLIARTAGNVISAMDIDTRLGDVNVQGLADADGDGREEVFLVRSVVGEAGVGSSYVASIAVFHDCELTLLTNVDGRPYDFAFGGGLLRGDLQPEGAGVGCADADEDGTPDLVGLSYRRTGDRADWTSTIVEIDGATATNGDTFEGTFTIGVDDEAITRLSTITCADATFENKLLAEEP